MQTEINKTHYWLKSPKKIKQKISPKKNYLKKKNKFQLILATKRVQGPVFDLKKSR